MRGIIEAMARPALQLARPSGAVPGSYRRIWPQVVSVLMTDRSWRLLHALGWVRDTSGGWRILLEWYADQPERTQREDWYAYDPGRIRLVR